jgi:uncharacterized protein YcgI (DUF1989 family)
MNLDRQIPAQQGCAFILKTHQLLKVTDIAGEQVADLFCYDLHSPSDVLSSGRSIDYNDTIRFTTGHLLYAHSGNPMLEIMEDRCGTHDFLVTPCSLQMFKMLDPEVREHPSCEQNLINAVREFNLDPRLIATTFNIFMNIELSHTGRIKISKPLSRAGDFVVFKAHRDLVVALTACSDEGTNNGTCKPISFQILNSDQRSPAF